MIKAGVALVGLASFLLYIFVWLGVYLATESECFSYGARSGAVDVGFKRYCISRVMSTDVVVPLDEARLNAAINRSRR